ncbi:uncharacterized protein LOC122498875 [Leptopilina heterotoma]|uniref:uncharacterized protein LOC122498875 n=1 Tax=Leptopilina heterotoma TaxID=63436 RepID=UPI001CA82438|nr:uncharacterized protein LOC122498875 [Leptopilina heterotoma]
MRKKETKKNRWNPRQVSRQPRRKKAETAPRKPTEIPSKETSENSPPKKLCCSQEAKNSQQQKESYADKIKNWADEVEEEDYEDVEFVQVIKRKASSKQSQTSEDLLLGSLYRRRERSWKKLERSVQNSESVRNVKGFLKKGPSGRKIKTRPTRK